MKKRYKLFWSPEGRPIATVLADTPSEAVGKAPLPYRKYLGEIYAEEIIEPETIEEVMTTLDESVPQSVARVAALVEKYRHVAMNHRLIQEYIHTHNAQIDWWDAAGRPS